MNVFSKWFVSVRVGKNQKYFARKKNCQKIPEQIATVAYLHVILFIKNVRERYKLRYCDTDDIRARQTPK